MADDAIPDAIPDAIATELRRIADLLESRLPNPALPGARPAAPPAIPLDPEGEKVFEALRTWRRERARKEGVSPYIVAYDRTLREVARARPGSVEALQDLPGFGASKAAKYGTEILEVVTAAA